MKSDHSNVWAPIYDKVHSKYNVVAWIDVLDEEIDLYPKKLYQRFLPWKDAIFNHDQRIVILHKDTEYYFENSNSGGIFLQNLYKIFNFLNVPSEFVIILHLSHDICEESKKIAKRFNIPPVQTVYCPYCWCPAPQNVHNVDLNFQNIQKPFVCLNGLPRLHRMYTLSVMKELDIFHLGITSLWRDSTTSFSYKNTKTNLDISIPNDLHLYTLESPTRINDELIYTDAQQNIIIKWFKTLDSHCSSLIDGKPNLPESRYQPKFLQLALWNVVTETVGEYPHAYFTEKTWKAILTKRPFVLLGGRGSLAQLKQMGFKTFDKWINESYDQQLYFTSRCDLAIEEIKLFCQYNQKKLQEIALEMQEILEHNFNNYIRVFGNTMLEDLLENRL